jgi:hypothetical protein
MSSYGHTEDGLPDIAELTTGRERDPREVREQVREALGIEAPRARHHEQPQADVRGLAQELRL